MEAGETDHHHQRSSSPASSGGFPTFGHGGGVALHHPAYPVLGLGLALGMSFLATALLPAGPPPKPLAVAIKLANEAVRGSRALHSPGYSSLVFASETLVRGYKFSTSLNLIPPANNNPLSSVVNAVKPCLGAVNVVGYVRTPVQDLGFLGFGLLSYGYKVSNNFLKVLKGVGAFEMDVALKNGFDSLGLVLKLLRVARELGQIGGRCRLHRHDDDDDDDDFRKPLVRGASCSSSSCTRPQVVDEEEVMAGVWVAQPQVLCLALPLAMDGCC